MSLLFTAAYAPCSVHAETRNPNPNIVLSIVGEERFAVTEPSAMIPGFAVRLTNPEGVPFEGLAVEFLVDAPLCTPTVQCNLPPAATYGRFSAPGLVIVNTDANGIARSGGFIGGTLPGSYRVAASLLCINSPRNCSVLNGQGNPSAFFEVSQNFVATPVIRRAAYLDGHLSGNWFDPAQSGQGLTLDFTAQGSVLVATWFVFGPNGGREWIYAQGTYDSSETTVTLPAYVGTGSGARFPPQFRSSGVQFTPWGTMSLSFSTCDDATLTWSSTITGYGSGTMNLKRLSRIRGTSCPD